MKKLLFVSALAVFAFTGAFAQSNASSNTGFKIGGGLNVLFPVSHFDAYSVGVGVDLLAQYRLSQKIAITGDLGYTSLMVKSKYKDLGVKSSGIVPIRAGIRFYPTSDIYIGGKVGVGVGTGDGSTTTTAYSFGVGYMLSPKLDVSANYDGYSKNSFSQGLAGVRLGYTFGN